MRQFQVGDKVIIRAHLGVYTIAEVLGGGFYCLDEQEVQELRRKVGPNYENLYYWGDLYRSDDNEPPAHANMVHR